MSLTFVVPVRHPENAPVWSALTRRLEQTIRSISAQNCDAWDAVVVANREAELPSLPERIAVERVDFPPNPAFDLHAAGREAAYDAVRLDKGRRILAGMLSRPESRYFMVVDDDDFVSNRLAAFVRDRSGENGWWIERGYIWSEGRSFLYLYDGFSHLCGTSHIVRADLLGLPEQAERADLAFVKRSLGSHIYLAQDLAAAGTPLGSLPFPGAVYRVGHSGAHSQSPDVLSGHFLRKDVLLNPRRMVHRMRRLRPLSNTYRREFFGEGEAERRSAEPYRTARR